MQSITNHNRNHKTTMISHWLGLALLMFLWLLTGCTIPLLEPYNDTKMPVAEAQTVSIATPTPLPTVVPVLDDTCEYAVVIRDSETNAPIENAKITLEYQLNDFRGYTDAEGRYRGIFLCAEEAPRYQLRIEANDYQIYSAEFTLMEKIEEIYLIPAATRFCPYVISVLDEASSAPVADAKVRIEYKLYYAGGYTDDEGYYNSKLPCAEELPQISVAVHADDYETYSVEYTLLDEIKEVRLTFVATPTPTTIPTPTPTATLFPPRAEGEVLVLVADILVPGCINDSACPADPDDVTQRLVSTMRKNLAEYPEIRVERLKQFIEEEGGSERAMEIGRSPEFDATFMIWGNYLGAPEVYLFFDIMNTELPFFGGSYDQAYGPNQIQQPSMFEFKADLGEQWAYVTAFATGLTLFQAGNRHHEAEPLFDIAAMVLDVPENIAIDPEMSRYIYFYRGTNYLNLGRANLAEPDLNTLYEMLDPEHLVQDELGAITLGNLGNVYRNLGEYSKTIESYESALNIAKEIGDRKNEGTWIGNLGNVYQSLGEYEKAIEFSERALTIAQEIGDRQGEGNQLGNLGIVYHNLGEYKKAIEFYESALNIAKEIGNRKNEGIWIGNLGNVYHDLGEYEKAIKLYESSLTIAQEIGDRQGEGSSFGNLGNAYRNLGEYQKAIEFSESVLTIAKEIGDRNMEGSVLGNLGIVYLDLGDYEKAITLYESSLTIAQEIGDRNMEGSVLGNLGNAYRNLGEYKKAIEYYESALTIAQEIGDRNMEGSVFGNLGNVYRNVGEYKKAIGYYESALTITQEIDDLNNEETWLNNLGNVYLSLGEYEKAIEFFESGLAIAQEIGDRQSEGNHLGNLGIAHGSLGDYNKAIEYLTESYTILDQVKSPEATFAYQLLGSAYNSACWASASNREPEIALPYCEKAVKHDPESWYVYGSRGLAYALLGETEKAIADFQFAVDRLKALDDPETTHYIEQRQGWIDALEAGENPFTDDMLAALREEYGR